jgi:hypothetical protein
MKIRTGFVSNSSSSSFVAIGFNLKNTGFSTIEILKKLGWDAEVKYKEFEDKDKYTLEDFVSDYRWEAFDELGLRFLNNTEDGVREGDKVICRFIAETSDDYFEQEAINIGTFMNKFGDLEELRKKIVPDIEMQLYTGTRMC